MMDRLPRWLKGVTFGALMLLMTACSAVSVGDLNTAGKLVDKVAPVAAENRPLRVCLMAAGLVEVMTDRIQMFDGASAPEAIGRLQSLQGAISMAKLASPLWSNTDMTDVAIQFARVLKDAGQEKLGRVLLGGPSVLNFLDVAARAALLGAKGEAVLKDINSMLKGVESNKYTEEEVWKACEERIEMNRSVLGILSGIPTQ